MCFDLNMFMGLRCNETYQRGMYPDNVTRKNNHLMEKAMPVSMFQITVPVFINTIDNVAAFLKKGEEYSKTNDISEEEFLRKSLAPDMFNLTQQIQTVSDIAKGGASRLAGQEAPTYEDNETSFTELYERLDKTVEYLNTFSPDQIDGSEENIITLKLPNREIKFPGLIFALNFAIPNFYFHATSAYGILRHSGVDLTKIDFLGKPPE